MTDCIHERKVLQKLRGVITSNLTILFEYTPKLFSLDTQMLNW